MAAVLIRSVQSVEVIRSVIVHHEIYLSTMIHQNEWENVFTSRLPGSEKDNKSGQGYRDFGVVYSIV